MNKLEIPKEVDQWLHFLKAPFCYMCLPGPGGKVFVESEDPEVIQQLMDLFHELNPDHGIYHAVLPPDESEESPRSS